VSEAASPWVDVVDVAPVIAELVHGELVHSEQVSGPRTNTLHRVELRDGRVLGVKRYARGRDYAVEGAALRELAGVVAVPEIVYTLDRVIAYRWIAGVTLADAARAAPAIWDRLAAPLGALLGALARIPRTASGCLVHGALDPEHVIVTPALDAIAGVIDWETATAGSPLVDPARLFRGHRLTAAQAAAFASAHGQLPADWARQLDARY
jgi:hypothetical protein